MTGETETASDFFNLSDDVVLNIFFKLENDPRDWARLGCVCTKFSSLINGVCYKNKCITSIPSISVDLLPSSSSASSSTSAPPGGWSSLHKIAVCCPGLRHAGVLLENSDFGLHRELGLPYEPKQIPSSIETPKPSSSSSNQIQKNTNFLNPNESPNCFWSLYDDLYLDTVYHNPEDDVKLEIDPATAPIGGGEDECGLSTMCKRQRRGPVVKRSHLASGSWKLSREQGNKLLASRFRGDCLYICDWPGCVHIEDKRNYMLFRGIFKNFKRSGVWRTINDGGNGRSRIDIGCAFCGCKETWDLQSAFCLRRVFGYHDDGQPVVRAFVCENGHVSGAWTDWPLYV